MEGLVKYEKGDVVIFQFPFSDIGDSKKRPSLVVFGLNYVVDCATLFANGTCSIPS